MTDTTLSASEPRPAAGPAPASHRSERARELARLESLAHTLDARFRVPLTGFRVGLDGIVGLIPGIGDTVAALPSAYMVFRGWQLGARKRVLGRMAANTGIDFAIGAIPVFGDIFDLGFKGNLRNVALLRAELALADAAGRPGRS